MIFEKKLKKIRLDDLKELVDNKIPEDKHLEYKGELDLNNPDHKRKLLKTVCAFANTNGGLLIYGISESEGNPEKLNPLSVTNHDQEKISILSSIMSNSEPTIPSIEIEHIEKSPNEIFILIKVPRSWNLPHRVKTSKKTKDFYIRRGNYSEKMDIFDLRTAFNLSDNLIDRIKRFREERISNILSDQTPVLLKEGSKVIMHLIPINAFYPGQKYEIELIANMRNFTDLQPIYTSGFNPRHNFDGFLTYNGLEDGRTDGYVQLYRNGVIESTSTELFDNDKKMISRGFHEKKLVESIKGYLENYKKINVEMPIFIFITITGVKEYTMYPEPGERYSPFDHDFLIDRDILIAPEVFIERYDDNIGNNLKPVFDSIWNACGYSKSENYDKNEWNPK